MKTPGPLLVGSRQRSRLIVSAWVPAMFWDDHSERAPCDGDPETAMAREVRRAGRRVLIEGDAQQLECLRSDAAFYAGGNVDDCAGLVRSAAATLRALEAAGWTGPVG